MIIQRITAYLNGGGLFNPELADHDAVRELLLDARHALIVGTSTKSEVGFSLRDRIDAEVESFGTFEQADAERRVYDRQFPRWAPHRIVRITHEDVTP